MDAHDILTTDFPIPPTEPMLEEAVMPHMEAGDMLLFDTRTIRKLAALSRFRRAVRLANPKDLDCRVRPSFACLPSRCCRDVWSALIYALSCAWQVWRAWAQPGAG